jgi:hypothetical protein
MLKQFFPQITVKENKNTHKESPAMGVKFYVFSWKKTPKFDKTKITYDLPVREVLDA